MTEKIECLKDKYKSTKKDEVNKYYITDRGTINGFEYTIWNDDKVELEYKKTFRNVRTSIPLGNLYVSNPYDLYLPFSMSNIFTHGSVVVNNGAAFIVGLYRPIHCDADLRYNIASVLNEVNDYDVNIKVSGELDNREH